MHWRKKRTSFSFSIKNKILYTFILWVIIPSVLILVYCIHNYSQYALTSIIKEKHSIMDEINKNISLQFSNFRDTTMTLYYTEEIKEYIDKEDFETKSNYINQYLSSLVNSEKYISSAILDLGDITYEAGYKYLDLASYFDAHRQEVLDRKGRVVWIPTETIPASSNQKLKNFVLGRAINSPKGNVGILWLFFSEDFFKDILENDSMEESAAYYIIAPNKRVLTSNQMDEVGELSEIEYMDRVIRDKDGYFYHYNHDLEENEIVVFSTSRDTDWSIVTVTLESVVFKDLNRIKWMACFIFMFYIVFLIGAYIFLTRLIFKPLEHLSQGMGRVSQGDFDIKIEAIQKDEIGMLTESYNYMVDKIQELMEQIRAEEKAKNEERMKVLAMQIGPHFIYNTLNTIKWMAVVNKQDNIRKMIESLIKLMVSVTYNMDEEITVEEEIELLKCYVYIQKTRYMNFDILFDVDDAAKGCRICKLVLQPLVENSILYAFKDKVEGGLITVVIRAEGDLMIEVEDNGKGFDVAILDEDKVKIKRPDKIGLENISERIRLNYGGNYGITIISEINKGTKIIMKLPLKKKIADIERNVDKQDDKCRDCGR